jgi:hypothetical protein
MFRLWDTERRTWWRDKGGSIDGSPLDLPRSTAFRRWRPPPRVFPHKDVAWYMVEKQLFPKPSGLISLRA